MHKVEDNVTKLNIAHTHNIVDIIMTARLFKYLFIFHANKIRNKIITENKNNIKVLIIDIPI